MTFDEVRYVDTFPQTFSLNNGVEVDLESMDILGVNGFRVYDSLLIMSTRDTEGFWYFLSLPDCRYLGKFLTMGQGPYEFYEPPAVEQSEVMRENGNLFAVIYHFHQGKLYKMNIDESLRNRQLNIKTIHDALPTELFDFVMIDSLTYFCKEISDNETQQNRYILVSGERIVPRNFEKLNSAQIRDHEDYNLLATQTKYNFTNGKFVEITARLNYINMYSTDGSFAKTICVGKRLDNIEKIQDTDFRDRLYTFSDLRQFPRFWGVVLRNEASFTKERTQLPSILLFDWNGKPLAQLNLTDFAQEFDIDLINGHLYTLDRKTDVFCRYDIRDILAKL